MLLVYLLVLVSCGLAEEATSSHHKICVIGAGPGGLQIGYFLQRAQRDYIIFERNSTPGSFFIKYPRHRTLISINKRHTGSTNREFNFRHDWNSLISDNASLEMRHYTKEYFPAADIYYKYLNDYTRTFNLNIQYNTEIVSIGKDDSDYVLEDHKGLKHTCEALVVSTGLWVPNIPKFTGSELAETYDSVSIDPDDFEGQTVFILGRGNAGFETAQNIVGATGYIHIASRSRVKHAYQTHYVGDLRAINNQLVDTYQLKSLDGFLEFDFDFEDTAKLTLEKVNEKLVFRLPFEDELEMGPPAYDRVILCTGFKFDFSIFEQTCKPLLASSGKYPAMKANYESYRNRGMFFAGTAGHSVDYRRSAGGFIHGFRYTARSLFRHMEWRYFGVPWPSVTVHATDLTDHFIKRINEASGLYQMFGVLGDVALLRPNKSAVYLEDVPIGELPRLQDLTGHKSGPVIIFNFEYGANYSGPGKDTLREDRAVGEAEIADKSNFLHPVLYYFEDYNNILWDSYTLKLYNYTRYHHVVEDFNTDWTQRTNHIVPLRRFIEAAYARDLRHYSSESCFKFFFQHGHHLPEGCRLYKEGQSFSIPHLTENGMESEAATSVV